jgi:NADPH:quinone reductase-like Zn-dependent oxidoreductase
MKAVIYRRYGSPEVLEHIEIPDPVMGNSEILVKVRASSVNVVDWKIRSGKNRIPGLRPPRIPGLDVAGEVVQTGKAVTRFKRGDLIFAMLSPFRRGACAEYVTVPEKNAARMPKNLSFAEAAAVPVAGLAALQALRDHGKIKNGDRILINGASGGVGSFAVQIAKTYETEVTAVTSKANLDFVKSLGADRVMDYSSEDFTKSGGNYDIIFDTVAKRSFSECKPVLSPNGIYVTTVPSPRSIIQLFVTSITGGKQARLLNVRPRSQDLDILREWLEAQKIRPVIDRTYPLSKTAEAHAYSEAGHARGKIVILVSE